MPHAMPIMVMAVRRRLKSIASQAWPSMSFSIAIPFDAAISRQQ